MRLFLWQSLLVVLLAPSLLWATAPDKNRIQYPDFNNIPWPDVAPEPIRSSPWVFNALLLPGSRSVHLQSKSFEGETPTAPQIGFGLSVELPHRNRSSHIRLEGSQAQYRSLPQPLSPGELSETQVRLQYENLSHGGAWNWGFAVNAQKNEAKATLPNPLIASRTLAHIGLVAARARQDAYQPDLRMALLVPVLQQESSAKSGDFQSGGRLETQVLFQAGRLQNFGLQFGLEMNVEQLKYSGLGERGSREASETQIDLRFPIGLEWTWP